MTDDFSIWDCFFQRDDIVIAPQYLQMTRSEAAAQAMTDGISWVRVVDLDDNPKANITFDYVSQRLTLLIAQGRVVRSSFF
jgi:hypothetical protein